MYMYMCMCMHMFMYMHMCTDMFMYMRARVYRVCFRHAQVSKRMIIHPDSPGKRAWDLMVRRLAPPVLLALQCAVWVVL